MSSPTGERITFTYINWIIWAADFTRAKPYRGDPPEVKGEPNNGLVRDTENCVGIKDEGWIERNCNREYAFLCQKPTL